MPRPRHGLSPGDLLRGNARPAGYGLASSTFANLPATALSKSSNCTLKKIPDKAAQIGIRAAPVRKAHHMSRS